MTHHLPPKNDLLQIVNDLYDNYKDNDIIFNKFSQYIENLPDLLINTNNTIIERAERKSKLEKDSEQFIQKFLFNHNFYYHTPTEMFFEYKNNNYILAKEDDIHHTILSRISSNKELMDWKYKLKIIILKKIKERDIFSCIPESETIQYVINHISSSTGSNKEQSKYFLTVLGDILLKKCDLIYFLNPKTKPLIKELNNLSYMLFGTPNLMNIFKFKYYEHTFNECRIIDLHDNINQSNWSEYLKQNNGINLFCVAAYYSIRYEGGDHFLSEQNLIIDFLKIDIEGLEPEIIKNSKKIFKNLIAVRSEVTFTNIFKNNNNSSGTFSELHNHLTQNDFMLLNLDYDGKGDFFNKNISLNDKYGILQNTDAVWIRNLSYIKNNADEVFVLKLGSFLILNNGIDLALFLLETFSKKFNKFKNLKKTKLYNFCKISLLKHLYSLKWIPGQSLAEHKKIYEKIFNEKFLSMNEYNESKDINPY